jgi:hypothetical protein
MWPEQQQLQGGWQAPHPGVGVDEEIVVDDWRVDEGDWTNPLVSVFTNHMSSPPSTPNDEVHPVSAYPPSKV